MTGIRKYWVITSNPQQRRKDITDVVVHKLMIIRWPFYYLSHLAPFLGPGEETEETSPLKLFKNAEN